MVKEQQSFDFFNKNNPNITPMMRQYLTIKSDYHDCLLFYRMGDFYELFFEDAIKAASILQIALTKRGKHENQDIPMCGVPYHSSENYLNKLIESGYKVAICEQIETPEEAKKRGYKSVVRREVVRVITPGTITEEALIKDNNLNYLVAIAKIDLNYAISWMDITTGEFSVTDSSLNSLPSDIARLSPKEILISEKLFNNNELDFLVKEWRHKITIQVNSFFDYNKCELKFKNFYNVHTLESFGNFTKEQICACGAILEYLCITQINSIPKLNIPSIQNNKKFMAIDLATRRNLEIITTLSNEKKGSLLDIIDKTVTPLGKRLLNKYIISPLVDSRAINHRQKMIEFFIKNENLIYKLQDILAKVPDIERCIARIVIDRAGPRDLLAIKNGLIEIKNILELFEFSNIEISSEIKNCLNCISNFDEIIDELSQALRDNVPILIRDGGFIKQGYNNQLDQLYEISNNTNIKLQNLKRKYIDLTGINNLKISKNNVLGFYIEVSANNATKIKSEIFIHRQSLVSGVRYTTEELKKLESDTLNANDKIIKIEIDLFNNLVNMIKSHYEKIYLTAQTIATLDVISSLAYLAKEKNYVKPIVDEGDSFVIKDGRHPVIEAILDKDNKEFVTNDCNLEANSKIWLLTGPNMAGKSTFLRQNALIAILAQIGSYVPASYAHIGVIDRIFSRVGAADDLARGRSTFMVEMVEAATILNQATSKSLVILDELGRGTATFDGLSISWSCLEYLYNIINCRTLFATHYHELTELNKSLVNLKCYSMSVKEWENNIIFLHKVIEGSIDKSYGIHVARLAGLPNQVTKRAEEILSYLQNDYNKKENFSSIKIDSKESEIAKTLHNLNLDELTPKNAMELLYSLKSKIN